jgi:hypothetical protein
MRNTEEFRNPRRNVADAGPNVKIDEGRRPESVRSLEEVKRPIDSDRPLIEKDFAQELRERWNTIQTAFVDQPKKAVDDANGLIEDVIKHLSDAFTSERSIASRRTGPQGREDLEGPASTEEMRLAFQRCRAIFARLISI